MRVFNCSLSFLGLDFVYNNKKQNVVDFSNLEIGLMNIGSQSLTTSDTNKTYFSGVSSASITYLL